MARITKDYDQHTKEALLGEAHARNIEGINTGTTKADIIAALQLDDESEKPKFPPIKEPAPDPRDARIAELEKQLAAKQPGAPSMPMNVPSAVDLDAHKDGSYKRIGSDEVFQLKIVKDDPIGRTHKLKNKEHFIEVNEKDFRAQFEKA